VGRKTLYSSSGWRPQTTAFLALVNALNVGNKAQYRYSGSARDILHQLPHLVDQNSVQIPSFGWQIECFGQVQVLQVRSTARELLETPEEVVMLAAMQDKLDNS
jgi:hypothetical protein